MHLKSIRRAVPAGMTVVRQTNLADQDAVAVAVGQRAELGRDCVRLPAGRSSRVGSAGRARVCSGVQCALIGLSRRPVGLDDVPEYVDPESVDAAVEPETQHAIIASRTSRVAPVEIGLLLEKRVKVILAGRLVPLP